MSSSVPVVFGTKTARLVRLMFPLLVVNVSYTSIFSIVMDRQTDRRTDGRAIGLHTCGTMALYNSIGRKMWMTSGRAFTVQYNYLCLGGIIPYLNCSIRITAVKRLRKWYVHGIPVEHFRCVQRPHTSQEIAC